jgi:hypothetical protein
MINATLPTGNRLSIIAGLSNLLYSTEVDQKIASQVLDFHLDKASDETIERVMGEYKKIALSGEHNYLYSVIRVLQVELDLRDLQRDGGR